MKTLSFKEKQAIIGNEDAAREYLEASRWPNGPVCPHCGSDDVTRLAVREGSKRPGRAGLLKCKGCRKQFTVTVGTIFEGSHIPLGKWILAVDRICASKKGISAHQLHRELGVTYKSAWFMAHRIRYAMGQGPLAEKMKGVVEVDETYVGPKGVPGKHGRGAGRKTKVVSLIQREGRARSFVVQDLRAATLKGLIREHVDGSAQIMTDEFPSYRGLGTEFAAHGSVKHGQKEYVRGIIHVNFAESYFSLLKRGIVGTFHHVSERHMQRYLDEFDFRWNTKKSSDGERAQAALSGIEGKRLMYRDSSV